MTTCKCRVSITYVKQNDKWIPMNQDGSEHWCEYRLATKKITKLYRCTIKRCPMSTAKIFTFKNLVTHGIEFHKKETLAAVWAWYAVQEQNTMQKEVAI